MTLGMIGLPNEESFIEAQKKGLQFLEFCVNPNNDINEFFSDVHNIKSWMNKYNIGVCSIGRWKAERFDQNGNIIDTEFEYALKLIDAASELGCLNFVCGCNYVDKLSYYENCTAAIDYFTKLIDYGKNKGVRISTYNCRKVNFIYNPMAWEVIHGHLKDLGIKYDPSHARYDGADYLKEMADWGERFYHIHLKGSLIIDGQRFDDPPVGLDQTDWKSFMSILYAKGYSGGLSLEPHSSVWSGKMGEEGLDYSINYINQLIVNTK